jgi:AraC-like DNA-binding protein
MSYDREFILRKVSGQLREDPTRSLKDISRELRISPRTIENAVKSTVGKHFRHLRREILIARFESMITHDPTLAIKQIALSAGFRSARSFARSIRRACGLSPQQLRSQIACRRSTGPDS